MKRIVDWFCSWFANARTYRRVAAVERRLNQLDRERQRVEKTLDRRSEVLASSEVRMRKALDTAQSTIRQYDETLQEQRAELGVANLEIELMAASHQRNLKRLDAETAIEARRELGARPFAEDRGVE